MRYFLFAFFVFISSAILAQAPAWSWVNQIGGPGSEDNSAAGYDGGHTTATDPEGNVYITGNTNSGVMSIGTFSLPTAGGTDIYVAKVDSNGVVQWAIRAGGTGNDYAYGVAVDSSGNVYVAGAYQSFHMYFGAVMITNVTSSGSYSDIFIAKFDPNGNIIWAHTAGTSTNDLARCISVDAGGNAYITGPFGGTSITFGTYTLTNNYYLAKYDPNGNIVWANDAQSNGANAYGNSVDTAGNIYVTGIFYLAPLIFGTDTLYNINTNGSADIFLVKYDSLGSLQWAKRAGGTGSDLAYCVQADSSGRVFVCGGSRSTTFSFGSTVFTNFVPAGTSFDAFVLQFDDSGSENTVLSIGGNYNDQATSVAVDTGGYIVVTGFFASTSVVFASTTLNNTTPNTNEPFVAKFSPSGIPMWIKQMAGSGNDVARSVSCSHFGDIFVSGELGSPSMSFGNFNYVNSGFPYSDMFLGKIGYPSMSTEIQNSQPTSKHFIYPNPNNGIFTIQTDEFQSDLQLEIYTSEGLLIRNCTVNPTGISTVNIANEPAGFYFVRMITDNSERTERILKQE